MKRDTSRVNQVNKLAPYGNDLYMERFQLKTIA